MSHLAIQSGEQRGTGQVVIKALLQAAEAMGLTDKTLSGIIGASESTVSQMKAGAFLLGPDTKTYELSVMLIYLFRSLGTIVGSDSRVIRNWMTNSNVALGGKPIDKITTISGLNDVLAYLDARRAIG